MVGKSVLYCQFFLAVKNGGTRNNTSATGNFSRAITGIRATLCPRHAWDIEKCSDASCNEPQYACLDILAPASAACRSAFNLRTGRRRKLVIKWKNLYIEKQNKVHG